MKRSRENVVVTAVFYIFQKNKLPSEKMRLAHLFFLLQSGGIYDKIIVTNPQIVYFMKECSYEKDPLHSALCADAAEPVRL